MLRNAGDILDLENFLGGYLFLRPFGQRALIDAEDGRDGRQCDAFGVEHFFECDGFHETDSCATRNRCQQPKAKNLANDRISSLAHHRGMPNVSKIHPSKQPRRPHFIPEWAGLRQLTQADLARELGADKSLVSRWFSGSSPGKAWQVKLAAMFETEPDALFRHPDDDWLARFFAGRKREEIDRIKATLEAAFPRVGRRA